jgi:hypothetical protein
MKTLIKCGILMASLLFGGQVFAATTCTVTPTNVWNNGYQLEVKVTNTGTTAIDNWAVTLHFSEPAQVTGNWNSIVSGGSTNNVAVSNAAWNGTLAPGQTTSFGLHGNHDGSFILPSCSGSGSASIDVVSVSVTNTEGQAPVKGDAIRLNITVINNGSESATATLTPKISSSRFSDFNNVNLPATNVTLAASEQLQINVDAGPFVHDTVTQKHYALGSSAYTIDSVSVNGTLDANFSGGSFNIGTSNAVLVPVLYDQAYLDSINYQEGIQQYLTSAFTRPSEVFTPENTYNFYPGGLDEIMNMRHILYPLPGFTASPNTGFCEQATAAAKTMLGLAQDWVGPVSTNPENHGFDYLIGLTPEIGGGATCGWLGVQVSGIFEVGQPLDLTQAIFVHEVGHVLGAPHCDPLQGYIMCGGEHHPHYIENGIFVWHYSSIDQMSNLFD